MSESWVDPLITGWGDALGRVSVQTGLSIVILLAIERGVPWLSAACRSWLWRLMYLKIALLVCLPMAWQIPLLPANSAWSASPTGNEVVAGRGVPGPVETGNHIDPLNSGSQSARDAAVMESSGDRFAARTTTKDSGIFSKTTFLYGASCLWLICVAGHLSVIVAQWHRLQTLMQRVSSIPQAGSMLRRVAEEMGVSPLPRLVTVAGIGSPMVVGYWRPCVLLPTSFVNPDSSSSADEQRMALAHELAHVVRRDLWWNLLVAAVQTLLCFHPLVWIAGRRYFMAQESACDQLALQRANLNRVQFAELLIRVSQRPQFCVWNPAGVPLFQGRGIHFLRERLSNMQPNRTNRLQRTTAVAAATLGLAISILPWSIGFAQTNVDSSSPRTTNKKTESGSSSVKSSSSAFSSGSSFGSASSSGSGSGGSRATGGGTSGGSGGGGSRSGGSSFAGGSAQASGSTSASSGDKPGKGSSLNSGNKSRVQGSSGKASNSQVTKSSDGSQVATNREVTDEGEEIRVTIQEKQRDIQLRQSDADGIEVFIRPTKKNPDQTVINITAATAEELKEKNSEAYEVYHKYLQSQLKKLRAGGAAPQENAPPIGAGNDDADEDNPAQKLMKQHLRDLLMDDSVPAVNRAQIQQMLNEISK